MRNLSNGNIWAACSIFGTALGFILAYFTKSAFGFVVGALLGTGTAIVLTGINRRDD